MRFACTDFTFRCKHLHVQSCTNPRMRSLRSLIREYVPIASQTKNPSFDGSLVWLDDESVNGTFYSTEHYPNFNIEEVKELIKENQEADNDQ